MKTLTKLALAIALLATAASSRADWVDGYTRANGTCVSPHYRTPANDIPYDNLSYRGYPSQQPGYISPRSYGYSSSFGSCYPTPVNIYGSSTTIGDFTFHNYYSTGGGSLSGSTINIGNTSFTTLYGW